MRSIIFQQIYNEKISYATKFLIIFKKTIKKKQYSWNFYSHMNRGGVPSLKVNAIIAQQDSVE